MNLLQKAVSLAVASFFLCASPAALAKTILYVPQDDRPVDYEYTVSTAEAAGILSSSIFPSLKRITQVYLHFGQNRGNSSNTVRGRICVLVLPPHFGQQSQPILVSALSAI